MIDRAWNVIFGELGGRAYVNNLVKAIELCYGDRVALSELNVTHGGRQNQVD